MSFNYFCSRCYNFVDACDCIDYSYTLEMTREEVDPSIPQPPEDDPPEVGTIWYFRVPIRQLREILEQSQAEKVGLDLLLAVEELWTLDPLEGGDYLSIPVDRLKLNQSMDTMTSGTYNKYLQPWEMNYFNFDSPLKDIATLAQQLAKCARKTLGRRGCQLRALGSSFIGSLDLSSPPIPQALLDQLSTLPYGSVDPALVAAMVLSVIPSGVLSDINSSFKTAVDFAWVYQHILDGTDPQLDYDKIGFDMNCIWDPADCLNDSLEFSPLPRQASKVPTVTPEKGDHMVNIINWKPKPLNPIVIPHEEEDDDITGKLPPVILPPLPSGPPDEFMTPILVSPPRTTAVVRFPIAYNLLSVEGINRTDYLNYPVFTHAIDNGVVDTRFITQQNLGFTKCIFPRAVTSNRNVGTLTAPTVIVFTRLSGSGSQINIQFFLPNGEPENIQTFNADSNGVISIPVPFRVYSRDFHMSYTLANIRGQAFIEQPSQRTEYRCTCTAYTLSSVGTYTFPSNICAITPRPVGAFDTDGALNNNQIQPGVRYYYKDISINPLISLPPGMLIRNEINMESFAPNQFVPPGSLGYAAGSSGTTGGGGSLYLPLNPVGVSTITNYKIGIQKSQGRSAIVGIVSYGY